MGNSGDRGRGTAGEGSGDGFEGAPGPAQYPDLESEIEEAMAASGRTGVVPRAGLVGAHQQRNASLAASVDLDEPGEPAGPGAEVAPTRRAEQRERARHQLERELGVFAAGDQNLRQQRKPGVTREALARAHSEADRVASQAVAWNDDPGQPSRPEGGSSESAPSAWLAQAGTWLNQNRRLVAGVTGAAVATACLLIYAGRRS